MTTSRLKLPLLILLGMVLLILFIIYQNFALSIKHYRIHSSNLPSSFNDFKIIQISDLHSNAFGKNQNKLLSKIKKENPDIIVITGDLLSINDYPNLSPIPLLESLVHLAPTYYVYGNHEVFMTYDPAQSPFFEEALQTGVIFLRNDQITLTSPQGESILLVGLDDPVDVNEMPGVPTDVEMKNLIASLEPFKDLSPTTYTLLLAHRPEYFEWYSQLNVDLVLSGHAHGGIVQIPFVGGLYAPNQGVFPRYTKGKHEQNDTLMLISQGLGNSSIPFRVFNPLQLVSITLKSKQ